VSRN